VRLGALRLTFQDLRAGAVQPHGAQVWVFAFAARNEGATALEVWWPLQLVVRETQRPDGSGAQQTWYSTDAAQRAAGLPVWQPAEAQLGPGAQRVVTLAALLPAGTAPPAIGFTPDLVGGDPRLDLGAAPNILWFVPGADPYCAGNTAGPVTGPDQGGAVYAQPLPPTPVGSFARFAGWPMDGAARRITQGFGCTAFPELTGYDCPADTPYYHSGIDFASGEPGGAVIRSVVYGRVVFAGPTQGSRSCAAWPGSQPPHYNLGWAVFIQAGPYLIKNGHLQVNSNRVWGVTEGSLVVPGQPIGVEGSTGCSTGPHLHWMIQQGAALLDPLNFLGPNRAQRGAP
jgi:murein DD-endopeptidase MepM/ murein hydrolase activator NlpD